MKHNSLFSPGASTATFLPILRNTFLQLRFNYRVQSNCIHFNNDSLGPLCQICPPHYYYPLRIKLESSSASSSPPRPLHSTRNYHLFQTITRINFPLPLLFCLSARLSDCVYGSRVESDCIQCHILLNQSTHLRSGKSNPHNNLITPSLLHSEPFFFIAPPPPAAFL